MSSSLDSNPDVKVLELVAADQEDGLECLESEDIGLHELQGGTCDRIGHESSEKRVRCRPIMGRRSLHLIAYR